MTVRCGNKVHDTALAPEHHHESVAQVRLCFVRTARKNLPLTSLEEDAYFEYETAAMEAERQAEEANERWFEERGGSLYVGSPEEARDRFLDSMLDEALEARYDFH